MALKKGLSIGIDLGTTNSCVAIMGADGKPTVLENEEGVRTTPSHVGFGTEITVGRTAKAQAVTNPANTVYEIKRLMGQAYADVKNLQKMCSYKIVDNQGRAAVDVNGKVYSPEEISAKILNKLVHDAQKKVSGKITNAVITVPAYFNDAQRHATKVAAEIAGLTVDRLVNEPTAAALAYGLDKREAGHIIVYDLGGGTFDVSVLEISDGVIEVKSTNGDTFLGGGDFDNVLINYVANEFKKQYGVDLLNDVLAKQRLKDACEKVKIDLSGLLSVNLSLPFITANASGPLHLNMEISRALFESLVSDLIAKTKIPCENALKDAGLKASDIDEVVLVGGMTRMPAIVNMVEKFFGKKPHQGVNPDEVVALGAAVQAGVLQGDVKDILLLDVTPLSLGIETEGGIFTVMIKRNQAIPTKKSQVYSTAADNQTTVTIRVFQGEREMAVDNKLLAQFDLIGIESAPRGVPQIEVTFEIDANGIVEVSAKDKKTGKEQQVKIQNTSSLTEEEIKKAIEEAELYAEEDKKRRHLAEKTNQLETVVLATEKGLEENKDKISDTEKQAAQDLIVKIRQAIADKNEADMDKYLAEIQAVASKVAEMKQGATDSNTSGADQSDSDAPEVQDVEYKPADK